MINDNLSNFSLYSFNGSGLTVDPYFIIKDYISQIDQKVVLAVMLVFTGYTLYSLVLPRAILGLKELMKNAFIGIFLGKYVKFGLRGLNWLSSLSETLALGGALVIWVFAYVQGSITGFYLVWSMTLVFLYLVVLFSYVVGFIRNKGYREVLDNIKRVEVEELDK